MPLEKEESESVSRSENRRGDLCQRQENGLVFHEEMEVQVPIKNAREGLSTVMAEGQRMRMIAAIRQKILWESERKTSTTTLRGKGGKLQKRTL